VEQLFSALEEAIEKAPAIALGAAFVWGILSVLLSPCHLASIPLVVGFITGMGTIRTRKAFVIASVFSLGIFTTIGALGAVTALLGRLIGDVGRVGDYFVAVIFLAIGLHLLGVIPMPWSAAGKVSPKRKGLGGAYLLGLLFGIAVGPCTFAYFLPVLGVAFLSGETNVLYGILLVLVTAAGHCSIIIGAGTAIGALQRYLNWSESSKTTSILKKICGALVILGGLYLLGKA
jgi:cytochrome c-type biogenesis protein